MPGVTEPKSIAVIAPRSAGEHIKDRLDEKYFHPIDIFELTTDISKFDNYENIIICSVGGQKLKDIAVSLTKSGQRCVLVLVREDGFERVYDALEGTGVLVLSSPCSAQTLLQSSLMMRTANIKLHGFGVKTSRLEEKINEEHIISRAKLALMTTLGMSEADAHRYIEKQAMDMRASKRAVAENIIKTYES